MSKLKIIIVRFIFILMTCIYSIVIFNNTFVKSAHLLHHVVTNTLHQHKARIHSYDHHSHDGHSHGHTHNHLIDKALEQIDQTEKKKEAPATPATNTEVRFHDHFATALSPKLQNQKTFQLEIKYFNKNMKDQIALEPLTLPPQYPL